MTAQRKSSQERAHVEGLGQIILWPNGYAMTLANVSGWGVVRCCTGHPSPREAKNHGLVRLVEVAAERAERDLAMWDEKGASA